MLWPYIIYELDTLLTLVPEDPSFLVILIFTWCSYLLQRISCPSNSLSQTPLIHRRATWSSFLKLSYISNISPPFFMCPKTSLSHSDTCIQKEPLELLCSTLHCFFPSLHWCKLITLQQKSLFWIQSRSFFLKKGWKTDFGLLAFEDTTHSNYHKFVMRMFTNPINKEKLWTLPAFFYQNKRLWFIVWKQRNLKNVGIFPLIFEGEFPFWGNYTLCQMLML